MAFSQSFKRGQAPATCNFCEEDTKIKWKCINCDVLMCAKCKDKIHAKLKNSKDHNVIDIKEVGIYRGKLDFSELKCYAHAGQSAVMFCTTCDRLVCTSCISKIHHGHGFVEISEGCNSKVEKIQHEQIKAKEKIKELTKRKGEMSPDVRIEDDAKYKELMKSIEICELDLKNSVEKYVKQLKGEMKRKLSEFKKEEINNVEKVVSNLQKLSSNADEIVNSKDAQKIFFECEKLSRAVSIADIGPSTISFLPGQISPYNVGSLQVVSNTVNVRIVKQFQTGISRVYFMSLCPDTDSLWISDAKVLQKVKPVEHKLTIESTFNISVYGMAVTPTGDLLLSSSGSVLKQISGKTGELTDFIYSTKTLFSSSVHVTKDDKVIVGLKSGGKAWPITGRRAIIVMNQKGDHETIYEHDKNNIRIFTYVQSITITDNGNLCVVDKLSEDGRGRVVVLNRDGNILQIYTGHHEVNNEDNPFKPVNIVTTPSDNIIVTQLNIYILHILNNCGHLIKHYNIGDIGIPRPYSLCFTKTAGQLYIGCTIGVGSSEKAELYEVRISGC
ncbi:Hypothetical predicted protein [Mytilus galloprovincialis]|uniref:B box-type domain-containing protein n=1 Tax=Mytilus galloprovincialis TaxID=29158 RepID=A0A8B6FBB6_MYTGA|nr:Hypothetical predicted protein [Mytilus galloprovincialis]